MVSVMVRRGRSDNERPPTLDLLRDNNFGQKRIYENDREQMDPLSESIMTGAILWHQSSSMKLNKSRYLRNNINSDEWIESLAFNALR